MANKFFNKTPYILIIYDLYPEIIVNLNLLGRNNLIIILWKLINRKVF